MDTQLANLPMPVAALLASLIGATATIATTLIQLRIAWRKELQAREKRQPVTKQARRGPVTAVVLLLLASAIGGFALSQYFATENRRQAEQVQADLRSRLDQLNSAVQRLEQSTPAAGASTRSRTSATIMLGRCTAAADAPCSEQQAQHVTLCADLPATAKVDRVDLFVRDADSSRPWAESRVDAGQAPANTRFNGDPFERLDGDNGKQVCEEFLQWDSEHDRAARIEVHFSVAAAAAS